MNDDYFNNIFSEYISMWPEFIDLSDRLSTSRDKSNPFDAVRFPNLIVIHDEIRDNICDMRDSKRSDYLRILDWVMFKLLHDLGKKTDIIKMSDLNIEYIKYIFEIDLIDNDSLEKETKDFYFSKVKAKE